jgi:hypothetical protein
VAQLPIFEINMTHWLKPICTKKHKKKKEQPIILYHPLDQTAVDHVRASPSKSNEGPYLTHD